MRVVSGQWRGRKLISPKGDLVRPTTDRVKEAMFSILGPVVNGTLVLDLCCGAGGLAIEALSRGAERAILVDKHRKSLDLARRNLELCGARKSSYELVKAEAEGYFGGWQPSIAGVSWLLLCDPPYRSSVAAGVLQRLTREDPAPGFVAAIIEHGSAWPLDSLVAGAWRVDTRQYGESCLTVVRPGSAG